MLIRKSAVTMAAERGQREYLTMTEFASTALSIDLGRVRTVCEEEWRSFLDDLQVEPIPEGQDLRAFLLNWVAVFAPGAFPSSLRSQMATWMEEYRAIDQSVCGWAKPPLIGATLFALTDNPYWLRAQRAYFDYGGSQLRSFLHKTLALVAPRLSFDSELIARLDYGMKAAYFFMDIPLVLYVVAKGDPAEKLVVLKKWRESYFMNPLEKETVDRLLEGESAENPLQYWLLRNTSYVAIRLGCHPSASPSERMLPLGMAFSDIWDRVDAHPLFSPYVKLERSAERNPSD
jgi:hypothetical protein